MSTSVLEIRQFMHSKTDRIKQKNKEKSNHILGVEFHLTLT